MNKKVIISSAIVYIFSGMRTRTLFLKNVKFDPLGPAHWYCPDFPENYSYYNFIGSYYHAYIKVAQCPKPTGNKSCHLLKMGLNICHIESDTTISRYYLYLSNFSL